MLKRILFVLLGALVFVAPAAAQDSTIRIAFTQEPDNLNPMYTTMAFAGYTFGLWLEGAWELDGELNYVPVLVTELPSSENGGISEDGTTFTLHLREGMTWSDGDALDSADFLFTWQMYTSEANTPLTRDPYDKIINVETPDALTVVVTYAEPYAPWRRMFGAVLPEHVLRPVFETDGNIDNADWNRSPTVASGPYTFTEWQAGSFIRAVRNENYFEPVAIMEEVIVTFVPDDAAYVAGMINGDYDIGTFFAFSDVPSLVGTGFLDVSLYPSGFNEGWYYNMNPETGHPALQDVRVRRAIAMGFNRDEFNETVNVGATFTPASPWENTPYANPDIDPLPYDPDAAAALLDEAGWVDSNGDGTRDQDGVELALRFAHNTRAVREQTMLVAQQQLAEIGVAIIPTPYDRTIFFNSYAEGGPIATGGFDIAQWSSTTAFPDPDTVRFLCDQIPTPDRPEGDNWGGYCDPALDELFTEQSRTLDFDARAAVFHQIDQMIYDAAIWIGIWHDADLWSRHTRLANVVLNGATPFWNINLWSLAQ
jgi:peptide/nickel transport system substrate-binding protein